MILNFYYLDIIIVLIVIQFINTSYCNQYIKLSEKTWDNEWSTGKWDYLEFVPTERARIAVVGGAFCRIYVPNNGSILDIGCGEGATSDFLTIEQKQHYVGVDLSKEAIHLAKTKRGHPLKFVHSSADDFVPMHKFDAIIFADVLYYTDYKKILDQYSLYLNFNGVIIISIFHFKESLLYEEIFQYAREKFIQIDELDLGGYSKKTKDGSKFKVYNRIEVYKLRS